MTLPGFTAVAGMGVTRVRYGGRWRGARTAFAQPAAPMNKGIIPINLCERFPWLCVASPQINLSYQGGNPGTLTVQGRNFAPDVDVTLTICNCDLNPYRTTVHSSPDRTACLAVPPYTCFTIPGGNFTTSVPCFCGGGGTGLACDGPPVINQPVVMVKAQDQHGNALANGTTANPC